jgi:hypothetical protein
MIEFTGIDFMMGVFVGVTVVIVPTLITLVIK